MGSGRSRNEYVLFGIEKALQELYEESVGLWSVPAGIAERACAATRAKVAWEDEFPARSHRRVEAYFWAVVRGVALRSRGAEVAALKSRFALAAIVEDMRSRGMSTHAVRSAVRESHGDLLATAGISETQLGLAC